MLQYPEQMEIIPLAQPPKTTVALPGSKSITNRALVLAALSGNCKVDGVLHSEDTEVMVDSLMRLGFVVSTDWENEHVAVLRPSADGDLIPNRQANLFVGNSGTTMRFLTALVCFGNGIYRIDGVPRMRERPIQDLLDALARLGVDARSELGNGCPPVIIHANGLNGGAVRIKGDVSSQFLSALLLAAPFARGDTCIDVDGALVSKPYVDLTIRMLRDLGLRIDTDGLVRFHVPGRQYFASRQIQVEPDASAASYFWAAAAITGGTVTVTGLNRSSLQGDVRFVDLLAQMGCRVEQCSSGITVHGRPLHGIEADMNDISDTVMTLGAAACFAEGPTTIRNVAHIRHKETDRISALATELRRLGAEVEEFADGLRIVPKSMHGICVKTYQDHRMAMSLALVGLKVPGVLIDDPGCVAKTYPEFWRDLERLRRT